VRGADDACRHGFQRFRSCPCAGADGARTLPRDVAERPPERSQALPTGLEGDFDDGHFGVPKQRHRTLDAPRQQVTMRRHAECLLERAREMRLGYAAHFRQPPDRPGLVRGAVHAIFRAQQAPQEFRVLRWRHQGWSSFHWISVNRTPAANKLPKMCLLYRASHRGR